MPTPDPNDIEPNTNNPAAPKSRRRWLRFSLRSLLVMMLLSGITFAWVTRRIHQKRLERQAIAEMEKHGGHLLISHSGAPPTKPAIVIWLERWVGEEFFTNLTKLSVDGPMTDGGFEHVADCQHLKEVWVNNAKLTAEGLPPLKALHGLELLDLDNCSDVDTDLDFLDAMPGLTRLGLSYFNPTIAGWKRIKNLPNLRRLELSCDHTDMTNLRDMTRLDELELVYCIGLGESDLSHLEGLTQLKSLRLDGADMGDEGLKHLEGLKRLESLTLYSTHVTNEGAQRFKKVLPNCHINR